MIRLFKAYRVLAPLVGVLLLLGVVSILLTGQVESWTMYHVSTDAVAYKIGHPLEIVWAVHGWFYLVYLLVAFVLTRRAGWSLPTFLLMLLAGYIPVSIFFVEHWATKKLRAENPQLAAAVPA